MNPITYVPVLCSYLVFSTFIQYVFIELGNLCNVLFAFFNISGAWITLENIWCFVLKCCVLDPKFDIFSAAKCSTACVSMQIVLPNYANC